MHSRSSSLSPKKRKTVVDRDQIKIVLAIVAVVGTISALSLSVTGAVSKSNESQKLRDDVKTINSAISVYRAQGGNLSGFTDPEHVILKLKSQIEVGEGVPYPVASSSVIDPRVRIGYLDNEDAGSDQIRAFWDASLQRFVLSKSGSSGIKRFYLEAGNSVREGNLATIASAELPMSSAMLTRSLEKPGVKREEGPQVNSTKSKEGVSESVSLRSTVSLPAMNTAEEVLIKSE